MVRRTRDDWSQLDHYAILGVPVTASQDEINRAYRRRARATHPDVNTDDPGAERHFEELAAAREVLSDPTSRAVYDKLRDASSQPDDRPDGTHAAADARTTPMPAGSSPAVAPGLPVLGRPRRQRASDAAIRPGPVLWTPSEVRRP